MSKSWRIDEVMFSTPSGSVRGSVVGHIGSGKAEKRVLAARMNTNSAPSISTWALKHQCTSSLRDFSELLAAFADRVDELDAGRC